jgi:hypothetical protein
MGSVTNLGYRLPVGFECGDFTDLEGAIAEAVHLTPDSQPDKVPYSPCKDPSL